MSAFQRATKTKAKLRADIYGPAGCGKTNTSLLIASGMGGTIAVIDTESGSASKYADRFQFDVLELAPPTIDNYIAAIEQASAAGYSVLIIDSLTHAWQELLEEIDKLAKNKYKGNSFQAWGEGTPKQRRLIKAILDCKCHVIATMRAKTEWIVEKDERTGKSKPIKVGLAPEQGKGIEYEFDLLISMSPDHVATIEKDRTGKFQDQIIEKPGVQLGKDLAAWLNEGAAEKPKPKGNLDNALKYIIKSTIEQINSIDTLINDRAWTDAEKDELNTAITARRNALSQTKEDIPA